MEYMKIFLTHSIFPLQGQYYVYLSAKFAHHGWHVGLTKAGKAKRGRRTWHGQKAIQFARKPIVPVTPNFTNFFGTKNTHVGISGTPGFDHQEAEMAFIDEDVPEIEREVLRTGPTKIRQIKDAF